MKWWQTGIIYQIYPRSFQDSNGDGIGDLPGIRRRLDYLQSLNIDAVWISPIYPSPMHDFGYDVADYTAIHPMFGAMEDFDRLLAEAHDRGLRIILDLVPNHTSDEHPWFIESRSSRDNPRRDWYIWCDPAPDGGPPNNWQSHFGGSAWTLDDRTGQYYLHQFVRQQPELNYRHPEVLPAMLDVMRFWLDKGVDGFRVDVIWLMLKDELLRDEPPNPQAAPTSRPFERLNHVYTRNLPGVHDLIRRMRAVMDEYADRVMIGEIYEPFEVLAQYCGQNDECHLPFNFHLIQAPWNANAIRRAVDEYEAALPADGWPNWVLGNHDQPRVATRFGPERARAAQLLLLTLRGTPTCYYGDEIGMENVPIPRELWQDPAAINEPEAAHLTGRDPERTPMQWDDTPNSGFTPAGVRPWLPTAADYETRNVAVQERDGRSMLQLFRRLTALRRAEPALHLGGYEGIDAGPTDVLVYLRRASGSDAFLALINFSDETRRIDLGHLFPIGAARPTIALSTRLDRSGPVDPAGVVLSGNEGLLLRLGGRQQVAAG